MNNIQLFSHDQFGEIRVIDRDGKPWFIAKDVAVALGYAKPENAVATHCRKADTTPKQGGGFMNIIPESDVYRLIMRSKLDEAERFQDWVMEEDDPEFSAWLASRAAPEHHVRRLARFIVAEGQRRKLYAIFATAHSHMQNEEPPDAVAGMLLKRAAWVTGDAYREPDEAGVRDMFDRYEKNDDPLAILESLRVVGQERTVD